MKLTEIITLSKAGFKASEIRQMMIDAEADEQVDDPGPDPEDEAAAGAESDQLEDDAEDAGADDQEPDEPEIDYKKLYLEEKAARIKAQQANVRKDQPDKPSDDEIVKNMIENFY